MKQIILSLAIFTLSLNAFAQDSRLKEIRELYSNALTKIQQMKEESNCEEYMVVKKHYIVPAIGPVEETIEFFATDVAEGEKHPGETDFKPFFIRVKTDARPTSMGVTYEEFLYYPETFLLAFYLKKQSSFYAEEEVFLEDRTYLDKNSKFITGSFKIVSQEDGRTIPSDEIKYDRHHKHYFEESARLCDGFDLLMNRTKNINSHK